MANLINKFLNYEGLSQFLSKLKEYIENEIKKINGENLFLYSSVPEDKENPTITSQIEDLWGILGLGPKEGSLTEKIEELEAKDKELEAKDKELEAKDKELEASIKDITDNYVKDIKVVGSNGIIAAPKESINGNVEITIDGTNLKQMIENLGKVVNITGVYSDGTDLTQVSGEEGDFIIVGNKEYVYWDNKWYLLGDTTQEAQDITNLADKYNGHIHKFTPVGAVTSTFTGNEIATSSKGLTISYSNGVLSISTSHNHTVTPTGTVTSTFTGEEKSTSGLDSTHKVTLSSTRPDQIVIVPTKTPSN